MWCPAVCALLVVAAARTADCSYHSGLDANFIHPRNLNQEELRSEYWVKQAQDNLRHRIRTIVKEGVAKNVIMFLGDGMSVPTLGAARARKGQLAGKTGEEEQLSFEKFPIAGLSKTYCVNNQVADSACSATAYLCGVKANSGTIGVNAQVPRRDCSAYRNNATHVYSIAEWALREKRSAGVVTTTRITHASPAGVFASVADRNWENNADVMADSYTTDECPDIAHQMIHHYPANQFKVFLGGGKRNFVPTQSGGRRTDNRDLTEEWATEKASRQASHRYVQDLPELRNVNINNTDYLLGLFSMDHMPYNMEADKEAIPTLEEMTEVAIKMLRKNEEGFFLFVEGGRIDHAHHDNRVELALDETLEFAKAIEKARAMTSEDDTLIVVTADHSHVMAYNGYAPRGRDVLGAAGTDSNRVPYMTMSYTNGPGFRPHLNLNGLRPDVTKDDNYEDTRWRTHVDVPLSSETHGGEDVPVFASGPQQHLFTGLYEQSNLPHLMGYASCLGDGLHAQACSSAPQAFVSAFLLAIMFALLYIK